MRSSTLKKTLGISAAAGILGLLLWMGTALGFSSISVDAGYVGNLTILGTCTGPGCGGGGSGNPFYFLTVDAGALEIINPANNFGLCYDGGQPECAVGYNYTYISQDVFMHNTSPELTMCNTTIPGFPFDAGICFNFYVNGSGLLEFNNITLGGSTQTECEMDWINGNFSCINSLAAADLLGSRIDIPATVPAVNDYILQSGPDPKDAGVPALFFSTNTGSYNPTNFYWSTVNGYGSGYSFLNMFWDDVLTWVSIPRIQGILIVDAGIMGPLQMTNTITAQGITATGIFSGGVGGGGTNDYGWCLAQQSQDVTTYDLSFGACVNGSLVDGGQLANLNNKVLSTDRNNTNLYADGGITLSAVQGEIDMSAQGSQVFRAGYYLGNNFYQLWTPGLSVGTSVANSSLIKNIGLNKCTLSSGTCNAVVLGATGSSLCFAGIQGMYAVDAGGASCHAYADAGSASVYCDYPSLLAYPAPAIVGVHCYN